MASITTSKKLQDAINKIPTVREYVWDISSYEPVAEWEDFALTAVKEAFGEKSKEARRFSDAIDDREWRNTNRPDSVPPEKFVNDDFKNRINTMEEMLKGYLNSLSITGKQAERKRTKAGAKMAAEKIEKAGNERILKQLKDIQIILRDLRSRQVRLERRLLGLRRASKRGSKGVYDAKPRKLRR